MDDEQYINIEDGLSVGAIKYADINEIITEEDLDYIKNKVPELDERVGIIDDEIKEINSSLEQKAKQVDLEVERKRIDSFTRLSEGSTTGDAELQDIRISFLGKEYENAGSAIRGQFNDVYDEFEKYSTGVTTNITDIEGVSINAWIWKDGNNNWWTQDNETSTMMKYPLTVGKKYLITGYTYNSNIKLGFSNNDYKTGLFLEFPRQIDGTGNFEYEFIAQRNYIYVYYGKTNNNSTIRNITIEETPLKFLQKKVEQEINLEFTNGGFNGGRVDYDTTKMIRTNIIASKKDCVYLITYPPYLYSIYNIGDRGGGINHETYGSFSIIGDGTFFRLSFARIDGGDLNVDNFNISQIKVVEVYCGSKDYTITIASNDTVPSLKEKADIILKGNDTIYDTRLLQAIIGCDTSANILFYPGTYILDEVHQTKYGQYGILTTNEWNSNNPKTINIYGYQGSVFAKPSIDFRVSQQLHESLPMTESAIFLVPNPKNQDSSNDINVTNVCITINGIMVQNYDINKPIVAIDVTNSGATTIENTMVKVQKYVGYTKFAEKPHDKLVGIRVGYGSCYGIRNSLKHNSVRHHSTGYSCNGEHFIFEDCKTHDCMIGFSFGDKYTQPRMEHPNILIGCSIEATARLMILSRYGVTTESEVSTGEITLICIGLSTECHFKGIGEDEGYDTLPIKETIKGLYRGRIEADYMGRNVFENDGSGKNMTYVSY